MSIVTDFKSIASKLNRQEQKAEFDRTDSLLQIQVDAMVERNIGDFDDAIRSTGGRGLTDWLKTQKI